MRRAAQLFQGQRAAVDLALASQPCDSEAGGGEVNSGARGNHRGFELRGTR